jgi:uncharacterized protein (UPF0261 family)
MSVYLLATLDTKGREAAFVRDRLADLNVPVKVVDTGCLGDAAIEADITREDVFAAAGVSLDAMRDAGDRAAAVAQAAAGVTRLVVEAHRRDEVSGVIGVGGGAGTLIGTTAMRALPLGVPKVMVSTLASGDVSAYVGDKDVLMLNSIVDILGLNRISRTVLAEAAHAMAGMVRFRIDLTSRDDKPLVAATMFGLTTPCVERAREVLEAAGYEVLVFHATGAGGQAMESLIREGLIAGVLDITTTELADEIVGGVLSAGPTRLSAAAKLGIPQVVSVGATDMVNFWALDTVPEKFHDRQLHRHNDNITLMRTTAEECEKIGRWIAEKTSQSTGPAAVLLPLGGVSGIDRPGQPFDDEPTRQAMYTVIREQADGVEVIDIDAHINDATFAEAAAEKLIEMMKRSSPNVLARDNL